MRFAPRALLLAMVALACARDTPRAGAAADSTDRALTDSARVFNATAPKSAGTVVTLAVQGSERYDDTLDTRATCTVGEFNGERTLNIEAFARDAQLNFMIVNPTEGSLPVVHGSARRGKPRIANVQFAVHNRSYADGGGTATITDPVGRRGSFAASHFTRIGVKKHQSHGTSVAVRVSWECQ